jgi:hypothetical protein
MLRLRPYKASDADIIVTWLKDELTFRNWAADRYKKYPIQAGRYQRIFMTRWMRIAFSYDSV